MSYKIFNIKFNFDCNADINLLSGKIISGKCSIDEIKEFALCLAREGKYYEAIKLFLKLTDSGAANEGYYLLQAGYCYFIKEEYAKCIPLILMYLSKDGNDFQAHLVLGAAYYYID